MNENCHNFNHTISFLWGTEFISFITLQVSFGSNWLNIITLLSFHMNYPQNNLWGEYMENIPHAAFLLLVYFQIQLIRKKTIQKNSFQEIKKEYSWKRVKKCGNSNRKENLMRFYAVLLHMVSEDRKFISFMTTRVSYLRDWLNISTFLPF